MKDKVKKFFELMKKDYLKLFTIKELWFLAGKTKENTAKRCIVVGLPYYGWKHIEPYAGYDEELELKYEPTNKYDKWAVEVYCHGKKVGYVRKDDNKCILAGKYLIKQFKEKSLTIERVD